MRQYLAQHVIRRKGPQLLQRSVNRGLPQQSLRVTTRQCRTQSTIADQQSYTHAAPQPPRRSLFRSLVSNFAGATLCLALGVYIGWETLPAKITLLALLGPPPSDAETLSLYTPPDAASATINAHIVNHAVARSLRSNPEFTESRPHMRIPEAIRSTNLTGGTLAGPGKLVVPPLQFVERDGKSLVAIFYLGPQLCGHPGVIHGGLLATLLDEGTARCCFPALPNGIAVTASLKVDYRRPVMAEGYYVLRARTEKVEGRKAWVRGWIERLGEGDEELGPRGGVKGIEEGKAKGEVEGSEKLVEAEALFIEPRNAQLMKQIYRP